MVQTCDTFCCWKNGHSLIHSGPLTLHFMITEYNWASWSICVLLALYYKNCVFEVFFACPEKSLIHMTWVVLECYSKTLVDLLSRLVFMCDEVLTSRE